VTSLYRLCGACGSRLVAVKRWGLDGSGKSKNCRRGVFTTIFHRRGTRTRGGIGVVELCCKNTIKLIGVYNDVVSKSNIHLNICVGVRSYFATTRLGTPTCMRCYFNFNFLIF
jgi:hypothetical protein